MEPQLGQLINETWKEEEALASRCSNTEIWRTPTQFHDM